MEEYFHRDAERDDVPSFKNIQNDDELEQVLSRCRTGWSSSHVGGRCHQDDGLPLDLKSLPKEVSTEQASKILGVSKDTVLRLKDAGILEYRNVAPPMSSRPVFRFKLESLVEYRTSYQRDGSVANRPNESPTRRTIKKQPALKHFHFD